jgi:hypothetical protein
MECEIILKNRCIENDFFFALFYEGRGRKGRELMSLEVHSRGDNQVQGVAFFFVFFF